MHQSLARRRVLLFPVLLFSVACAKSPKAVEAPKSVARSERVSDANIAAIVVAANNADIAYANLAISKAQTAGVRAFAQSMLNDHNGVNQNTVDLVTRLGITPVENSVSLDLRDNSENTRDRLRDKDGTEFDRDYMDNELEYHNKLLKTIDDMLIPSATNPELKALLRNTRLAVTAHLEHAKAVRSSLKL
jgi:putative membrane protein